MFKTVIFLIIGINAACLGRLLSKSCVDNGIVDGVQENISEIPYIISLHIDGHHECDGALIAKNVILISAHCAYYGLASYHRVRLGSSDLYKGGRVVKVNEIHHHPRFNLRTRDYNFALLFIEDYDSTNLTVGYAKLPQQNQFVGEGIIAQTTEWAIKSKPQPSFSWDNEVSNEEFNYYLTAVNVPILNRNICKKAYMFLPSITSEIICAGIVRKASCHRDSGGPLILNNTIVGIVSWGRGCELQDYTSADYYCGDCGDDDYPGVYSRVSAARKWIKKISGV